LFRLRALPIYPPLVTFMVWRRTIPAIHRHSHE
jgi:hypothetical protein